MSTACLFSHLDGAYVLGALSPSERRDFEQHLGDCESCSRAVRELAGLPGLLSRVDADVLETPSPPSPVPETLLPSLLAEVRRGRRRRVLVASGLVAAALALAVALPLALRSGSGDAPAAAPAASSGPSPTTSPTTGTTGTTVAMSPLDGAPVRADLTLRQVAWGTRLDLACTYAPAADDYGFPEVATYVLVVRTRDGHTESVGTWRSERGRTMRLSAATAARPDQIAAVEVRTASGHSVLRLST